MQARNWNEVESIELTKWTQRFAKYATSLPPSAIHPIPGKTITEVLFETSKLRHSAVHRLPTSAAGMVKMLNAAITFAEALNDPKRAEKIIQMKVQLKASIEEIVQHQSLLERKLTDQLGELARRRAELDKLERSSIEEMLETDREQRTEVSFAFESFLVGSQHASNHCTCNNASMCGGAKVNTKATDNIEDSWIGTFLRSLLFPFLSVSLSTSNTTSRSCNRSFGRYK